MRHVHIHLRDGDVVPFRAAGAPAQFVPGSGPVHSTVSEIAAKHGVASRRVGAESHADFGSRGPTVGELHEHLKTAGYKIGAIFHSNVASGHNKTSVIGFEHPDGHMVTAKFDPSGGRGTGVTGNRVRSITGKHLS